MSYKLLDKSMIIPLIILSCLSKIDGAVSKDIDPREATFWKYISKEIYFKSTKFYSGRTLVKWGLTLPEEANAKRCNEGDKCLDFGEAKVVVTYEDNCERIHWTSTQLSELKDCLNLLGHWYGGGSTHHEPWPLESRPRIEVPFVSGDMLKFEDAYGGILESFWVSSAGIAVRIDETIPLFVSLPDTDNDGRADKMCFSSRYQYPFVAESSDSPLNLTYHLCYADDIRQVFETSFPKFFKYPKDIPDERMFTYPIWSSWATYFSAINNSKIFDLAQTIKDKGFKNSQFEIDDKWEKCLGDAVFDEQTFPDPKGLVDSLHSMDYRVTLWAHPFINADCESFKIADKLGYLVKDENGNSSLTSWWDGNNAGTIDFTNRAAAKWWSSRLENLAKQFEIDGYKFDAGEIFWLPKNYVLNLDKKYWPNGYPAAYVRTAASFGKLVEVRQGFGTQELPIFVRPLDKHSSWSNLNGLRTLIPSALHSGLIGYPFVLPDMIGGNAYHGQPSPELFIRWAQANTFMPSIQYSLLPWKFDTELLNVTQISRDVSELHEKFAPLIIELARNATLGMGPIMRPTWWLCPNDEICLLANQQFLLGDDLLVTPVVHEGAKSIEVVFPPGSWKQSDTGDIYEGVHQRIIYNITIYSNIYFVRI